MLFLCTDFDIFPLWIAASDFTNEGVFTWGTSGKSMNYSNWNTHKPNGGRYENCAVFIQTGEGFFWDDIECDKDFHFVCQYFDESLNHHF